MVVARAAVQVLVDREISVVYSCMLCAGDYGREPLSRYFGCGQTLWQGSNFARLDKYAQLCRRTACCGRLCVG